MRVVVTGGAGFIGSHLVDAYLARGCAVTVIDDLSTGNRANVNPRADFIEASLGSDIALHAIRAIRPDVISHHAAQVDVRKSVADPAADAETNVVASVRLMRAAVEAKVAKFIFASSGGAIYGEPDDGPQRETDAPRPLSPYGCAKLAAEVYLGFFGRTHHLPAVALRYANVYGPRQDSRGEAGVVAIFCGRVLNNERLTINGSGEQTRDFVHVQDVVAANMAVTDAQLAGPFNVGTGVETSINDLARSIARGAAVEEVFDYAPAKEGEQMRSVLDPSSLRSLVPLPAPRALDDGLKETLAWFRAHAEPRRSV